MLSNITLSDAAINPETVAVTNVCNEPPSKQCGESDYLFNSVKFEPFKYKNEA